MKWDFLKPKQKAPQAPNLYREMEMGAQAGALIESAAYQRAVLRLREGIHLKWAASPVADLDGQNKLRLMLKLLDDMEAHVKEEADTGKLASKQVADQEKRKKAA
jgi:hypothetical protein